MIRIVTYYICVMKKFKGRRKLKHPEVYRLFAGQPSIIDQLQSIADKNNRTLPNMIETICIEYIDHNKWKLIELFNCHYNELLAMLPDKSIDIAICDIPYGIGAGKMAYTREIKTK